MEAHDDVLEKYWESVRLQWEKADYTKGFGYKTYRNKLFKELEGITTSLEVGFGDGRWIKLLREKGIHAYGIDILENAALQLKSEGAAPVVADARGLPFKDNVFDLVYSFGVVEHFENTEKAIEEHVRVATPGGKIIITVPYLFSPYTIYWMLIHMKQGTFSQRPATFGKRYTRGGFRKILQELNVEILEMDTFFFPILKFKKIYHENPLLNRFGFMLWVKMIKI